MARSIRIEGVPQLKAVLAQKAAEIRAGAIAAVASEVDLIGGDAESGAAVDTGEMRDDIERQAAGANGEVRATSRHSKFVEFGTYKDPAQPFMTPAASKARRRFPATAVAIIRKALGA